MSFYAKILENKGKNVTSKTAVLIIDVIDTIDRLQFLQKFYEKGDESHPQITRKSLKILLFLFC